MTTTIHIYTEVTPNPNALKFVTGETLVEKGSVNYENQAAAMASPLASVLFQLPGVTGVFMTQNFVTISKENETTWETLTPRVIQTLQTALASKTAIVSNASPTPENTQSSQDESTTVRRIKAILDNEIRPAVAMDGGDVIFYSYENGIVKLHLQGACSSCPSSIMTLKAGVENRLRMEVPEIKEVVQV